MAAVGGGTFAAFVVLSLLGIWTGDDRLWQTGLVCLTVSIAAVVASMLALSEESK